LKSGEAKTRVDAHTPVRARRSAAPRGLPLPNRTLRVLREGNAQDPCARCFHRCRRDSGRALPMPQATCLRCSRKALWNEALLAH
jgi:hypothetical protein